MKELVDFIYKNWDGTLRYTPKDEGTLIGLPKPYTVPSIKDCFNELYYWDTYFINVGLILSGKIDYAINNTENIAYLINRYGFMPNGSRTGYLNRSQPPFFSLMVRDVYDITQDKRWLSEMYPSLEREYKFWQEKRSTPIELNRYYHNLGDIENFELPPKERLPELERRLPIKLSYDKEEIYNVSAFLRIICESGWDCNSRMGLTNYDYVWIDLNSLMYKFEENMLHFSKELGNTHVCIWQERVEKRNALLRKYCWNEKIGMFCDYDFVHDKKSDFISLASFYPLFCGIASEDEAARTVDLLPKLEFEYGVACCEARDDLMELQWDYPHGWAPLHYMVIKGLSKYGYESDANRIAKKYCSMVERNFIKTGNVWEKYNTVTGEVSVTRESDKHAMMGWSAGIYLYCRKFLDGEVN